MAVAKFSAPYILAQEYMEYLEHSHGLLFHLPACQNLSKQLST